MSGELEAKLPNPMTIAELIQAGKTPEEARHVMNQRVFGVDYRMDAEGNPIEQGYGSPYHLKQFPERSGSHNAALALEAQRKKLEGRNDPIGADVIAAAVSAGVQAGLAAAAAANKPETTKSAQVANHKPAKRGKAAMVVEDATDVAEL